MAHTTSPIWGVVLKVLVKKGPLGIHFINGNPNQTGNLHYGHFGDRNFGQLPIHGEGLAPRLGILEACLTLNTKPEVYKEPLVGFRVSLGELSIGDW